MRRLAFLGLVLAVAGCNSLRVGPATQQLSDDVPAPPLVELWERNVDAGFGAAAPVFAGETMLVATREGDVVGLDPETGAVVGRERFGDSVEGPFALSPDARRLFVGAAKPGQIIAHNLATGSRIWRWRGASADAGLARVGDVLVAPLADGTLIGLDVNTGRPRWERRPDSTARVVAAPVVVGQDVLVADDRGVVRRLDAQTGTDRWTADVGAPVGHTPAAAPGLLVVPTTRGDLVALDPATGTERWRATLHGDGRIPPRVGPPSIADGQVVVGATNGVLVAFDLDGAERWRRILDAHVNAAPLQAGGRVYAGTTGAELLVLDAATGETVWETTVRGRVKSAVAGAGGAVYVLSEPRHVIAFGPELP